MGKISYSKGWSPRPGGGGAEVAHAGKAAAGFGKAWKILLAHDGDDRQAEAKTKREVMDGGAMPDERRKRQEKR